MSDDQPHPPLPEPTSPDRADREAEWHVRLVRRLLGPGPYLDHLCSDGRRLRRLAHQGPAAGYAPDPDAARCAREEAPGCPVVSDPAGLADDAFHAVVAVEGLDALDDAGVLTAIDLWKRVLRPGGRVLVQAPDAGGRGPALRGEERRGGDRDHARWAEMLEWGGLRVLRQGSDGLSRAPYGRMPAGLDVRLTSTTAQFASGRLHLAPGSGEAAVFVVEPAG